MVPARHDSSYKLSLIHIFSVSFGEVEGGWESQRQERLARKRASRRGFVAVLVKYPQLIENGLRLLSNRAVGPCGRSILIFADSQGVELAVACQWEPVTERDVERIKGCLLYTSRCV